MREKNVQSSINSRTGRSDRRPRGRSGLKTLAAVAAAVLAAAALSSGSDAQPAANSPADAGPIQITADELVGQVKNNYAEFIGNVEAVQGDFEIRSDRLRIYYRKNADPSNPDPVGGEAIEKIVAVGNVKIKSGSREAETDLAEYLVAEGLLVLKGENSTVTDGKNSIRGSVIRLNRLDGKVSVTGGSSERVRAVFHSSGREPAGAAAEQPQKDAAAAPEPAQR